MRPPTMLSLSLLASTALLATGCTFNLPTSSSWNWYARIGIADRTASDALTLKCPDDATELRMTSDIRVEQGTLHLRLIDPHGSCRLDETLRAGGRTGTLRLPASEGTWRCNLDYAGFGGDCTIDLAAGAEGTLTITVQPAADATRR